MNNNQDNIQKEKRQLLGTFFLTLPSIKKLHMHYNVSSKKNYSSSFIDTTTSLLTAITAFSELICKSSLDLSQIASSLHEF